MPVELELARSEWSRHAPGLAERAFEHHAQAFGRWLWHAGAEPRLATVLLSGPRARDRLVAALTGGESRIEVVPAPATPARPVHPLIAAHQGDHFNRTLYLLDGLDAAGDPTALLQALDAQVDQLRRMATWVAVLVESPRTLALLERVAPRLMGASMYTALALDAEMAGSSAEEEAAAVRWRADGLVAHSVFHHAMTPTTDPTLLDFDRLVRSGYVGALEGAKQHPERQRLVELWAGRRFQPWSQAGRASAEAAVRHLELGDAELTELAPHLSSQARAVTGLPVDVPELALWQQVEAMGRGEAEFDPAALDALAQIEAGPGLATHAALALAGVCAAQQVMKGCVHALSLADEASRRGVAPELRFEALEARLRLLVFTGERNVARARLSELEILAPKLCSPLYRARALRARGGFLGALDPGRARDDFIEAARLFEVHGDPERAASTREALE